VASSDFKARQWTHADALALAAVRDVKATASLMDLSVLGSLASGSAQAGCVDVPVFQGVRRLAPVGFAVQGISAPVVEQPEAFVALLPATAERRGTTVSAPRNYKSIATDLRPVTVKGGSSGVPPRGRPDEKG